MLRSDADERGRAWSFSVIILVRYLSTPGPCFLELSTRKLSL